MTEEIRLRDGLRTCLLVFLSVRVGLFVLSVAGVGLFAVPPDQPTSVPGWPAHPVVPGLDNLFTATERQDALWFLRIATDGYRLDDASAAFFPLYPILVRIVASLPWVGPLASALVVSNAAFLCSLLLLHGLVRLEPWGDAGVAARAVRYSAAFPTAFFLLSPYSESTYLLLVLATFWFARRDRWGWVAVAGLGAGLTRSFAVVLPLALALEAVRTTGITRAFIRLASAAAPAAGTALYLAAWWRWSGEPFAPISVQELWRPEASAPWSAFARGIRYSLDLGGWWLVDALVVAAVLGVLLVGIRLLRASYTVYGLASLTLPLFAMFPDRPFLSMPRFACVLFPVAVVLARQRIVPELLVTAVLAAGWGLLVVSFVNWQYIF